MSQISRRFFLQILGAAGVALALPEGVVQAAAVQTADLPMAEPLAAAGDPFGLRTMRITFPDGTCWDLQGFVTSQLVDAPIDGHTTSTITFRPSGECKVGQAPRPKRKRVPRHEAIRANVTTLELDGQPVADLQEIQLPRMERSTYEVTRNGMFGGPADDNEVHVMGLRRMTDVTFTCAFDGKVVL